MAANDNAVKCGTDLTLLELLGAAMGKDATGKPYLRLKTTTNVAGSKWFGCGNPADETNVEASIRALFTFDANGDISLRTGTA